jgi:streptogramin lyase
VFWEVRGASYKNLLLAHPCYAPGAHRHPYASVDCSRVGGKEFGDGKSTYKCGSRRRKNAYTPTDAFSEFQAPNTVPLDVAVAENGIVWFTDANGQIGRLDPDTGDITEIDVDGFPREINIASDGAVWFTERFTPQAVGRLDPDTNNVTLFPADGGPVDIAPAGPDGSMWFTRTTGGNIARISPAGVITATSKVVRGSEPFGITVAPNGDPWFTMLSADKIATLQLR